MLRDLVIDKEVIELSKGKTLEVRGLSIEDIAIVLKDHGDAVNKLFDGKVDMHEFITRFPEAAALVIAIAADDVGAINVAKRLPLGVQLLALEKVWDLTVPNEEALGKLLRRLTPVVQKQHQALINEPKETIGS